MRKILILQNTILHYRKALYNELSKTYDITILHSGLETVTQSDNYKEIIKKKKNIGPFIFQNGVLKEVNDKKYDVIISMLDLHWINNILSMFFYKKTSKFIWWGSWLTGNIIADKAKVFLTNLKHSSIFYTQEAKDSFIEKGVDAAKLFVANNTFDVANREKCYKNELKNTIIFVGSLDKRKQLDVLVRAFFNIKDQIGSHIKIKIIGSGSELDSLKVLVSELDLSNRISFVGKVNDTKMLLSYYKEAIVSVSYGQAGLSVLQSLGYGVPFITKINAISGGEKTNIIHGKNGFFCEDNQKSLENYLLKVCNNIHYARFLGKNAFIYYDKYCTIENMAQGFIDAIEN